MKQFIKNSLLFSFSFFFAQLTIAQTDFSNAVSFVDHDVKTSVQTTNNELLSNEQMVISQIIGQITDNFELPEEILEFYNSDVTVLASFEISKSGDLENIQIVEEKGDNLEAMVIQQLNRVKKVAPIISNGKVLNKRFFIPIIFQVKS